MFGHGWIAQTAGNTPVYAGIACNMRCLVAGVAHRNAVVPEAAGAAASTGSPYAGFALGTDADGGAVVVVDVIARPAALAGLLPGDNIDVAAGEKVGVAPSRNSQDFVTRHAVAVKGYSRRAGTGT